MTTTPGPMRWGILGADKDALDIALQLANSPNDAIALWCAPGSLERELRRAFPDVRYELDWDSLLGSSGPDAVFVAASDFAGRQDALRQLAQVGVPMLLSFPADESIFVCELDMIRRDQAGVIMPFAPAVYHPAVEQLRRWLSEPDGGPIGKLLQVIVERSSRRPNERDAEDFFAHDALLLETLAGRIERLGALGELPEAPDLPRLGTLSIHLQFESGALGRWSIGPAQPASVTQITLAGSVGTATLLAEVDSQAEPARSGELAEPGSAAKLLRGSSGELARVTLEAGGQRQEFPDWQPQKAMLEAFRRAVEGKAARLDSGSAYRAMEAAEAIEISRRKGRTVEFYGRTVTEQTTFKGMMAAGGCLLLLAGLVMLVLTALVDALRLPIRNHWLWRQWPWVLLGLFSLFLLLQLLQLLFPSRQQRQAAEGLEQTGVKEVPRREP